MPRNLNSIIAGALLSVLTLGSCAAAQDLVSQADWGRSFNGFAMIGRSTGLEPVPLEQWRDADPQQAVVIVLGTASYLPVDLESFMSAGGSVLVACDETNVEILQRNGIHFFADNFRVRDRESFRGKYPDCPIVRDIRDEHPVTRGLGELVTNRPAILTFTAGRRSQRYPILARFPARRDWRSSRSGPPMMVATENRNGGRLLAVSDPSIFTNQMLIHGDNARFTWQALDWLGEPQRNQMFLFVDGQLTRPAELNQTEIELPAPTREEVLEALQNLPPDQLIEFGNTVATIVEDEGMVNEFLSTISREIPPLAFQRFLILLATFGLGFWLWFGYFSRDTLVEHLEPEYDPDGHRLTRGQRRRLAARQRMWAARALLDQFLHRVTGHGLGQANLDRIQLARQGDTGGTHPLAEIRRAARRLDRQKPAWWNVRRLTRLETQVQSWNQLHESGLLVYDATADPETPVRQP